MRPDGLGRFAACFSLGAMAVLALACNGMHPAGEVASPAVLELGHSIYDEHCLACHQADGSGVPGMYPPLAGADWITGDKERLIRVVLRGLAGPIEVNGAPYSEEMAAFDFLTDAEISAVLTFVRHELGSRAPPISSSEVAAVRASPQAAKD